MTEATIISNKELMPGVFLLWVEAPSIAAAARPGQFVMVRCGKGTEHLLRRPLSIHQVAPLSSPRRLAVLYAVKGKGTAGLSMQRGGVLDVLGPLGNGFNLGQAGNILLIAGGIGVAPLTFLAQKAAGEGRRVRLVHGAATASVLCPVSALGDTPGIDLVYVTEDGSVGRKGLASDLLTESADAAQVFSCGPVDMYRAMAAKKDALGGRPVQVSLEVRMACGLGACFGCTIKTVHGVKQVCQDGPVFDLNEVDWDSVRL